MKRQVAFIVVLSSVCLSLHAQSLSTSTNSFADRVSGLPDANGLHISLSNGPSEPHKSFVYGSVALSLEEILEISLSRDVTIGSPLGWYKPSNSFGIKINLLAQQDKHPSISLFYNSMLEEQDEFLGNGDLEHNYPYLYTTGLLAISYKSRMSVAGIALNSKLYNWLSLNASIGVREMLWSQEWSIYFNNVNSTIPKTQDGVSFPLPQNIASKISWSAGMQLRASDRMNIIADVNVFPVMEINQISMQINGTETMSVSLGIRYYLTNAVNIEVYDKWYSSFHSVKGTNQLRIGLSSDLLF